MSTIERVKANPGAKTLYRFGSDVIKPDRQITVWMSPCGHSFQSSRGLTDELPVVGTVRSCLGCVFAAPNVGGELSGRAAAAASGAPPPSHRKAAEWVRDAPSEKKNKPRRRSSKGLVPQLL